MIFPDSRKLVGIRFGLSISEPPPGDPDWPSYYTDARAAINQFTFDRASNILFEGGLLVLGHRWGDERTGKWNARGVLHSLVQKSRDLRLIRPASRDGNGKVEPAIINLLAWPDSPPPDSEKEAHELISSGLLEISVVAPPDLTPQLLEEATLPEAVVSVLSSRQGQYTRTRALTAMRRELARLCDVRFSIGGAAGKSQRRLSGIIEEALFTALAKKPLYISSAFGGASKALADAIIQRSLSAQALAYFMTPAETVELYNEFAAGNLPPEEGPSVDSGWNALSYFRDESRLPELANTAGLQVDEYVNLLTTSDVNRAVGWMMVGVQRVHETQKQACA